MKTAKRSPVVGTVLLLALTTACAQPTAELGPVTTLMESGASNPTVAAAPTGGRAYVAWVATEGEESNVWLTGLDADGDRGHAVRVNDVDGDAAPHLQAPAQVAAGPDEQVYVLWTNNAHIEGRRFPASDLRFARSTDGGATFEPAITVNDDAGGPPTSHTFHNLLVAPGGTIIASWLDSRRGGEGMHPAETGMAVGEGHVTSDDMPEVPGPDVRVAISTDGGRSFAPSHIVNRQACPCCRTAMAMAPDGTLYLAWRKIFEGDVRDIVVARSTDKGISWEEPRRVAEDDWVFPGCPHAGPALTVDPSGALHVAWYTGRESAPGLFYTKSVDAGLSFQAPTPLLSDAWVPPSQVSLGAESDGTLWVAWEERRLDVPSFYYVRRGPGKALSLDGALNQSGSNPVFATAGGPPVMAWLDGDAVRVRGGGG